jgi:ubiquinone/menaquinone biosynthesis C-methylase UbiE
VFQAGTEQQVRDGYMPRLELSALRPRADGQPVRILEVGIGTGANLAWVRRDLPPGLPVEIWGVDLSQGMLRVLQRRLRQQSSEQPRLLMADAHALPFPTACFDRVFHTGAIGNYRAPDVALAEMARVAMPGTPIVVVDEQLDTSRRQGLYHRLMFRLVTFYDRHPHAPVEHLPPGAVSVRVEQISRFFYCLSFQMPGKASAAP